MADEIYSEDIKKVVIQRIKAMPSNIKLCFGDNMTLSISEMVDAIETDKKIGNEIVEMHLDYLKSFKESVGC